MAGPSRGSANPGVETLLRTIVGQQVSVAAARSMWNKLDAAYGAPVDLAALLEASDEELREAGLSRQKAGYARSLAGLVLSGELDLASLPDDDEEAIALLTRIKGIGRWSAEIYLLFAEGRGDVWPAGDLAVQIEIGRLLGLRRTAVAKSSCASWPRRGARTAAPPRCSPGTATTVPDRALACLLQPVAVQPRGEARPAARTLVEAERAPAWPLSLSPRPTRKLAGRSTSPPLQR